VKLNKDIFEAKWEQIRPQSKVWWSLLTEDDLDKVEKAPNKFDKYTMLLRVKYGYTRDHAREEITTRIVEMDAIPANKFRSREKQMEAAPLENPGQLGER
jgi:hypothetical protein